MTHARRARPPTHVSAGDLFVVSNRLVDAAGHPFGSLRAMCFVTEPGTPQNLHGDCFGVFSLPSGQLWAIRDDRAGPHHRRHPGRHRRAT